MMMKRLYILLILLTAAFWGSGQTYLPDNTFGKTFNRILPFYALGIPNDTLAPPVAYQHYPHLAGKDSILYLWSPSLKRFRAISAAASGGGGGSYTFLAPLSNDGGVVSLTSVPWSLLTGKPTTLSGYGITDAVRVSDTAAMLSGYMRKGVAGSAGHTHIGADITDGTTWVRNMLFGGTGVVYNNATGVIAIDSALVKQWLSSSTYTFTGPLSESAGTVSISQARPSTAGYLSAADYQKFFAKTDSIKVRNDSLFEYKNGTEYARGKVSASIDSFLYATRRYVDSSVVASTPTLQQVLTAGSDLTDNAFINAGANRFQVYGDNGYYEQMINGFFVDQFNGARVRLTSYSDGTGGTGLLLQTVNLALGFDVEGSFKGLGIEESGGSYALTLTPSIIPYSASTALKHLAIDTTNGKIYRTDGASGGGGASYTPTITTSAATSLTLSVDTRTYVFNGTAAATWTLPAVTGNSAKELIIINKGTAELTLSGTMWNGGNVTTLYVLPGDIITFQNDGTDWLKLN